MSRVKVGSLLHGRLGSVWKVIDIRLFESKVQIAEQYFIAPIKNYSGNVQSMKVSPSDIGKIIFTEKRTEEQMESFANLKEKNSTGDRPEFPFFEGGN